MKKTLLLTLLFLLAGVRLGAQMPRTDMERLAYQDVDFNRVLTTADNEVALKSTDVPAQYSWVFDGGRKDGDMVTEENGEVLVYMNSRSQADFTALMALVKAHGYNLDPELTSFGEISAYEARSASGARCSIMFNMGNLMVAFH